MRASSVRQTSQSTLPLAAAFSQMAIGT